MISYGGKVFRVVTPNHPGDPCLESAGPIRTEYLAAIEPVTWCLARDAAFVFPRHLDAVTLAAKIPHCHATTDTDGDQRSNNLRAVAASSSGAAKQAVSSETSKVVIDAPRPQTSLPVPVLAGAQPVSRESAGHCASVRGSTSVASDRRGFSDSRGGQNSFPSDGNASEEMIGNRDPRAESVSASPLNDPGIPLLGASREKATSPRADNGEATPRRSKRRSRMAALKRAHERTGPADSQRFWWREGQMA